MSRVRFGSNKMHSSMLTTRFVDLQRREEICLEEISQVATDIQR
ncbi:MAG: hypothetical protein ACRD5E_00885 [Nitrososphaeraceae archaeon]